MLTPVVSIVHEPGNMSHLPGKLPSLWQDVWPLTAAGGYKFTSRTLSPCLHAHARAWASTCVRVCVCVCVCVVVAVARPLTLESDKLGFQTLVLCSKQFGLREPPFPHL